MNFRRWGKGILDSRHFDGFTLIELVVVLVILAILISVALPRFMNVKRRAYRAEALQIMSEIKALAWAYHLEHGGSPTQQAWPANNNWTQIGYTSPIQTGNWYFNFTKAISGPKKGPCVGIVSCSSGGLQCERITANGQPGTDTDGMVVRLFLDLNGTSCVDYPK